ncbi:MAG: methyltransferase domain-containing protein [bacterium]
MFSDPQKIIDQLFLTKGQVVIDMGSGTGFYTKAAAKAVGSTGHVYAIDLQIDLLRRLKKEAQASNLENVQIVFADLEKPMSTKVKDSIADLVIIANLLFMIKNKEVILAEAKRVLKPGGRLLVVDWQESFGGIGPQFESVIDRKEAQKLGEASGFTFNSDIEAGSHHYGLIFKKI